MISFKKICVIGAGTMGSSIAQWFCQQGITVELTDTSESLLQKTYESILVSWDKLLAKNKFQSSQVNLFKSCLSTKSFNNFSKDADLVIEAIIEDINIKKALFKQVASYFPTAILASNTSSLSISKISEDLDSKDQARFLGLHFFNPATVMKLVEIIPHSKTSVEHSLNLKEWFLSQGKKPALCKDSPGFIVNRVARGFYGEPLHAVSKDCQEVYSEIDHVLKEVGAFRMGPFELMDLIGIDVNYTVTQSVWNAYNQSPRFRPHPLQKEKVNKGDLGRKTKKGFFLYE